MELSASDKLNSLQEEVNYLRSQVEQLTKEKIRLVQSQIRLTQENYDLKEVEQCLLNALELAFLDKSDLEIMIDLIVCHGDAVEVGLFSDVAKASYLAGIDELTQLPNRRQLLEYLDRIWRQMMREGNPISLLMCDVDYFKLFNDYYGHQAGDKCLKEIAQAIGKSVHRPIDLATRYGGEEFVIVLPNTDQNGAINVANAIREAVEGLSISHENSEVSDRVTISIGLATVLPKRGSNPTNLIQAADQSLFAAKRNGRNRVEVFSDFSKVY